MSASSASHQSVVKSPPVEHVTVRVLPDGRLPRREAAKYLGVAEKTLAMWQLNGRGPRSMLVGGRRFYLLRELEEFVTRSEAEGA